MCATRRDGEGAAARETCAAHVLRATLVGLHPTWAFAEPSGRRALSKMMRLQEAERCRAEPVAGSNRRILPRSEAQKRSMSGSRKVHMWVAHDAKGRERTLVGEQRTCMVTILCSMSYATSSHQNVGTLLTRHVVVRADVDSIQASESPHSARTRHGCKARNEGAFGMRRTAAVFCGCSCAAASQAHGSTQPTTSVIGAHDFSRALQCAPSAPKEVQRPF